MLKGRTLGALLVGITNLLLGGFGGDFENGVFPRVRQDSRNSLHTNSDVQ